MNIEMTNGNLIKMRRPSHILLWVLTIFLLVVMYAPVASLLIYSFSTKTFFSWPIETTLKWYPEIFKTDAKNIIMKTLVTSLITGAASTIFATLGSLAYVRYAFTLKAVFRRIVLLPIFFPQLVLGIFILIFLRHLNLVPSTLSMIFGELVFIARKR